MEIEWMEVEPMDLLKDVEMDLNSEKEKEPHLDFQMREQWLRGKV